MPNSYHPLVYKVHERLKPYTTRFNEKLEDGIYAFDLYEDPGVIPLVRIALFHIYKGTYYVKEEEYSEKFQKPGNIMIAYIEEGKPMVATCLLWVDVGNLVSEVGQAYSLTPKKPFKFMDFADFFLKLYRTCEDLPVLFMSKCRKSATDATSEMFGMKMSGIYLGQGLRVDYERYLDRNNLDPTGFKGPWYNVLYSVLNYHFQALPSRCMRSMQIPDFLRGSHQLETFWNLKSYDEYVIPYKSLPIPPRIVDLGFDESNHHVITSIWPISHPDILHILDIQEQEQIEAEKLKKCHETIIGTAGPFFYYAPEDIFIPGIILAKGTLFPYYFSVEDELDTTFQSTWRQLPETIQEMLKVCFYGFNVTKETRSYYQQHEEIFHGLMLNPQLFRGLTQDEREKIKSIIWKYPSRLSEQAVINKLDSIIKKK